MDIIGRDLSQSLGQRRIGVERRDGLEVPELMGNVGDAVILKYDARTQLTLGARQLGFRDA